MTQENDKYSVKNKVAVISGGSRGIGKAVALKLASEGCNIAILAKTDTPHPVLKGTIHETVAEVKKMGVDALAVKCDIREEDNVNHAVQSVIQHFGQIDYVVNNASAIYLTDTIKTGMKQFDLMFDVNVRGTYMLSRACIPYLRQSDNAHIITFAPPLVMDATYFHNHLAYTMSKYGMSMCTLGLSHEFYHDAIAVNSLWPRTAIYTAAMERLGGGNISKSYMRKPTIMADATFAILRKPSIVATGTFLIDDLVLQAEGVRNFDQYAFEPGHSLIQDLFLPHDLPPPPRGVHVKNINFSLAENMKQ